MALTPSSSSSTGAPVARTVIPTGSLRELPVELIQLILSYVAMSYVARPRGGPLARIYKPDVVCHWWREAVQLGGQRTFQSLFPLYRLPAQEGEVVGAAEIPSLFSEEGVLQREELVTVFGRGPIASHEAMKAHLQGMRTGARGEGGEIAAILFYVYGRHNGLDFSESLERDEWQFHYLTLPHLINVLPLEHQEDFVRYVESLLIQQGLVACAADWSTLISKLSLRQEKLKEEFPDVPPLIPNHTWRAWGALYRGEYCGKVEYFAQDSLQDARLLLDELRCVETMGKKFFDIVVALLRRVEIREEVGRLLGEKKWMSAFLNYLLKKRPLPFFAHPSSLDILNYLVEGCRTPLELDSIWSWLKEVSNTHTSLYVEHRLYELPYNMMRRRAELTEPADEGVRRESGLTWILAKIKGTKEPDEPSLDLVARCLNNPSEHESVVQAVMEQGWLEPLLDRAGKYRESPPSPGLSYVLSLFQNLIQGCKETTQVERILDWVLQSPSDVYEKHQLMRVYGEALRRYAELSLPLDPSPVSEEQQVEQEKARKELVALKKREIVARLAQRRSDFWSYSRALSLLGWSHKEITIYLTESGSAEIQAGLWETINSQPGSLFSSGRPTDCPEDYALLAKIARGALPALDTRSFLFASFPLAIATLLNEKQIDLFFKEFFKGESSEKTLPFLIAFYKKFLCSRRPLSMENVQALSALTEKLSLLPEEKSVFYTSCVQGVVEELYFPKCDASGTFPLPPDLPTLKLLVSESDKMLGAESRACFKRPDRPRGFFYEEAWILAHIRIFLLTQPKETRMDESLLDLFSGSDIYAGHYYPRLFRVFQKVMQDEELLSEDELLKIARHSLVPAWQNIPDFLKVDFILQEKDLIKILRKCHTRRSEMLEILLPLHSPQGELKPASFRANILKKANAEEIPRAQKRGLFQKFFASLLSFFSPPFMYLGRGFAFIKSWLQERFASARG